jgi:hypothetical protein
VEKKKERGGAAAAGGSRGARFAGLVDFKEWEKLAHPLMRPWRNQAAMGWFVQRMTFHKEDIQQYLQ